MSWFRRRRPVAPSQRDECECERVARRVRQLRDAEGEPQSPGFQQARTCTNSMLASGGASVLPGAPVSDGSAAPVGSSELPPRSLPPFGLPGSSQPGDGVAFRRDVVRGGFDLSDGCEVVVKCGCGRVAPCLHCDTEG